MTRFPWFPWWIVKVEIAALETRDETRFGVLSPYRGVVEFDGVGSAVGVNPARFGYFGRWMCQPRLRVRFVRWAQCPTGPLYRLQRRRDVRGIQSQFEQPHVPEAEICRRRLDRCNRSIAKQLLKP